MSKTLGQDLDEVVVDTTDTKAKQKQNARRLAKIHKLKQENRTLADKRNRIIAKEIELSYLYNQIFRYTIYQYSRKLCRISEEIGRNSAKIMRLRTLIKQSKIVWNNHRAFSKPKVDFGKIINGIEIPNLNLLENIFKL